MIFRQSCWVQAFEMFQYTNNKSCGYSQIYEGLVDLNIILKSQSTSLSIKHNIFLLWQNNFLNKNDIWKNQAKYQVSFHRLIWFCQPMTTNLIFCLIVIGWLCSRRSCFGRASIHFILYKKGYSMVFRLYPKP